MTSNKMKGVIPVTIITVVMLMCLIFSNMHLFVDITSDPIRTTFSDWTADYAFAVLKYYSLKMIVPLIFALYVFIFRKKQTGVILIPVIYTISGISMLISGFRYLTSMIGYDYSSFLSSTEYSLEIIFSVSRFILAGCCILIAIISVIKGYSKKAFLIPVSLSLITYYLISLVVYALSIRHIVYPEHIVYYSLINICDYLVPILMYTGLLILGLKNDIPSVVSAFRNAPKVNRNNKISKELKAYEDDLEELEYRRNSNMITPEQYNEVTADIRRKMDELRAKLPESDKTPDKDPEQTVLP